MCWLELIERVRLFTLKVFNLCFFIKKRWLIFRLQNHINITKILPFVFLNFFINNYQHCTLLQAGFGHHTSIFLKSYAHHCRHWMYYFLWHRCLKVLEIDIFYLRPLNFENLLITDVIFYFVAQLYWVDTNVKLYNPVIWVPVYVWCMWFLIVVSTGTFKVILLGVSFRGQWSMNYCLKKTRGYYLVLIRNNSNILISSLLMNKKTWGKAERWRHLTKAC